MTIVAEGVENFEEHAYLQAATRIRYAQGYHFSKPFFLEDMSEAKRLNFDTRESAATRPQTGNRRLQSYRGS
jgi:EAL domain-containing protein (putative c-di-GMP-specific phosphodiesterase class I)